NIDMMLQDKKLAYKLIKPLKTWDIMFKSHKLEFKIRFDTRYPHHYFGVGTSSSWYQHFEASGNIKGALTYKNENTININGYGQRDKSWGYRDWHKFQKWFAGHFQFENWTCGFRKDYIHDKVDLSGYIADAKGSYRLSQLDINVQYNNDQYKSPQITTYFIKDENGREFHIEARLIQKHSFIRFARDFPGGYTELFEQMVIMKNLDTGEIGSGMAEQLRTIRQN
ncbi:MAG: hypothetical protein ACTSU4_06165, partial [Promethearchaeota archaeon]